MEDGTHRWNTRCNSEPISRTTWHIRFIICPENTVLLPSSLYSERVTCHEVCYGTLYELVQVRACFYNYKVNYFCTEPLYKLSRVAHKLPVVGTVESSKQISPEKPGHIIMDVYKWLTNVHFVLTRKQIHRHSLAYASVAQW